MDWGLVSGIAAIIGVIINFIRFGRWQGAIETKVEELDKNFIVYQNKMDGLSVIMNRQNELLTEVKVKIDLIIDGKGNVKQ